MHTHMPIIVSPPGLLVSSARMISPLLLCPTLFSGCLCLVSYPWLPYSYCCEGTTPRTNIARYPPTLCGTPKVPRSFFMMILEGLILKKKIFLIFPILIMIILLYNFYDVFIFLCLIKKKYIYIITKKIFNHHRRHYHNVC